MAVQDKPGPEELKQYCDEHAAESGQEAVLFSVQDTPIMKSLSLYRKEPYTEHAGHQPVIGRFNAGNLA